MDWIIWVIVIVIIVGIVWWLLNRNSSGRGSETPTSTPAESGVTSSQAEPHETKPRETESHGTARAAGGTAAAPPAGSTEAAAAEEDKAEWEAQWSEAGSTPHAPGAAGTHHGTESTAAHVPVHHPEYTEPHAPTLPGAETAAAEDAAAAEAETVRVRAAGTEAPAEAGTPTRAGSPTVAEPATRTPAVPEAGSAPQAAAGTGAPAAAPPVTGAPAGAPSEGDRETLQTTASAAATESSASHTAEPSGHLAVDKPYGEGSAAPAPDGSGPAGYTVKGSADTMTYHDETSPAYEETKAQVWFESVAHAEAAGFRAPRRSRH
ncbi:hypothetical protein [Arthrobacter sp. 92]|uniref:sunset domain-containing protein n=1 Tax=Arthrobacter sp. 92 TaxID=3418175 RepID=UPI003CFD9D57